MKTTLYVCGVTIVGAVAVLWYGYVFMLLWNWLVVPTLDLPPLGLISALGLTLVAGYLLHDQRVTKSLEDTKGTFVYALTTAIIRPAAFLVIGWALKSFL
jgi:hypothetical protein